MKRKAIIIVALMGIVGIVAVGTVLIAAGKLRMNGGDDVVVDGYTNCTSMSNYLNGNFACSWEGNVFTATGNQYVKLI